MKVVNSQISSSFFFCNLIWFLWEIYPYPNWEQNFLTAKLHFTQGCIPAWVTGSLPSIFSPTRSLLPFGQQSSRILRTNGIIILNVISAFEYYTNFEPDYLLWHIWVSCLKWRHTKTITVKNCKTRNTWLLFAGESVVSDWPSFRAQIRDSCFSNAFLHAQPPGQPDRTQFLSFLPKTTPPRHFPPSIHSVKLFQKFH